MISSHVRGIYEFISDEVLDLLGNVDAWSVVSQENKRYTLFLQLMLLDGKL